MELERALEEFMNANGLRRTQQRKKLLMAIFAKDEHFTADQLMDRLRNEDLEASRSTVYRTLALLVEANLLKEVYLDAGQVHYDPNFTENPQHAHIVCKSCGKVEEFSAGNLWKKLDKMAKTRGFHDVLHIIKIEGICNECKEEGKSA